MSGDGLVTERLSTAVGEVQLTRGGPGAGEAVVYLHSSGGETGDAQVSELLSLLAADYRVFAPMLPGFAGSEGLEQIDDMEDAVYHTLDVFDRLGIGTADPPHVVGLSLGGWLGAEIAWRYPERVRTLTLVNAVGLYVPGHPMTELFGRRLDELAEETFADQSHPAAAAMHALASVGPKDAASVPFELVRPFYEAMAAAAKLGWNPYFHNPKMPKRLGRVTAPSLVLVGRRDGLVPNEVGEEFARLIPRARLEYVEEASHMMAVEHPRVVESLVRELIADRAQAEAAG